MMRPIDDDPTDRGNERAPASPAAPPAERPAAPRSTSRRIARGAALAAVPLAALGIAWWATREPAPQRQAAAHDHASMAAPGDSARPVTLDADQARRIGVTFAPVTASDLPRRIRTVGQVTFDETRLTTIAPKVDGWVERLYVRSEEHTSELQSPCN